MSDMRIELACAACGKNRFAYPPSGRDDAIVTCEDCGHEVGTLRFLKEEVSRAVLRNVRALSEGGAD